MGKYKCLSDASFTDTTYSDSSCSTTSTTVTFNFGSVGNCSKSSATYNKYRAKCGASASCTLISGSWYNKWKCVLGGTGSSSGKTSGASITAIGSSTAVLAIVAFQAR